MAFSFYYLFALDPKTRERFGSALQQEKSVSASFWFGVSFSFIAWFTTSIILFHLADIAGIVGLIFRALYGCFTGCIHSLPVHPWMYLTIIRGGVWMKVKKSSVVRASTGAAFALTCMILTKSLSFGQRTRLDSLITSREVSLDRQREIDKELILITKCTEHCTKKLNNEIANFIAQVFRLVSF